MKYLFITLITLYQKTLSPDHGPMRVFYPNGYCRFHPTCSEYGRQAFARFGTIKGLYLATSRVIRCHPWSAGGEDPLPSRPPRSS